MTLTAAVLTAGWILCCFESCRTWYALGDLLLWQPVLTNAFFSALGESYASELAQFNIRVTVVIPGSFRTNALGQPMTIHKHIADYDDLRERGLAKFSALSSNEKGDPSKAMELLVDVVRGEGHAYGREWPMWLFMGSDVYRDVRAKCDRVQQTLAEWEDVATDLEFDH